MRRILYAGLRATQFAVLGASAYQTAVTLWGLHRQPPAPPERDGPLPAITCLVCARNEEATIGRLLKDLLAQDYPGPRSILVVAHNCTDETAAIARDLGAEVLELDTEASGKGLALVAGFRHLGDAPDLVGVFDADSRVDSDFLRRVAAGIGDRVCVQVETEPMPASGWVGRGYGLERQARNLFWWRPREALGLGTTINGTGYFIRPQAAAEVLEGLRTVTEELEMTARLYARGHPVGYLSSTRVRLEEPDGLGSAFDQRSRWARGHFGVLWHDWPKVVNTAAHGDVRAFDAALHMAMPTRVITRTGATLTVLASLSRAPFGVPRTIAVAGVAFEWAVPLVVALRHGLVSRDRDGLALAARHAGHSMLWLPIGAWSLLTARRRRWKPVPRNPG